MKTIIAATNLSEGSNHAVAFAADVARTLKARLVIFNVIGLVPAMSDAQLPLDACDATIEETDQLMTDLLSKTKVSVHNEIEVKMLYKVGAVINELDALCRKEAPFAVFIASQFVTAFERFILGTYAVSIAKYSAFPVVVVPPSATMTGFKKTAIAIDLAREDGIPWNFLRHWLRLFKPQVAIVYIASGPEAEADAILQAKDIKAQLHAFKPEYHFLRNENIAEGIRKYIAVNKPDLFMMLVQRHGIFHKSVTRPFIEAPVVPTLFLSPVFKDEAAADGEAVPVTS